MNHMGGVKIDSKNINLQSQGEPSEMQHHSDTLSIVNVRGLHLLRVSATFGRNPTFWVLAYAILIIIKCLLRVVNDNGTIRYR